MLHCTPHDKSASYIIPNMQRSIHHPVYKTRKYPNCKNERQKNGTPNAGCSLINNFFYVYAPSRQELQKIACGVPGSRENHQPDCLFYLNLSSI